MAFEDPANLIELAHNLRQGCPCSGISQGVQRWQLVTHSAGQSEDVQRVLVLPEGDLAPDLKRCIRAQQFGVRRFKLTGSGKRRKVVLL